MICIVQTIKYNDAVTSSSNVCCTNTYIKNKQFPCSCRVRNDTFFQDLRSLTIILPNCDLRSLMIIFRKSHDRWSLSWSAIILPITINVSIKAQKTKSNLFYSISISKNFPGWTFLSFQASLVKLYKKNFFSQKIKEIVGLS